MNYIPLIDRLLEDRLQLNFSHQLTKSAQCRPMVTMRLQLLTNCQYQLQLLSDKPRMRIELIWRVRKYFEARSFTTAIGQVPSPDQACGNGEPGKGARPALYPPDYTASRRPMRSSRGSTSAQKNGSSAV